MRAIKEQAYAKINLFLDVVKKRTDGFHDVKTVMHTVSLADTLTIAATPYKSALVSLKSIGAPRLPTDTKNLAVAAAYAFLKKSGINARVDIVLDKKIPVGAGLAGGSSDAAATLRAMNKLFGRPFSQKALLNIGAELGSDVPYCILGGTAYCEGRGERITRLKAPENLFFVVAISDEYVSTPKAYAELDKLYSDFDGTVKSIGEEHLEGILTSLSENKLNTDRLYNIFEDAVLPSAKGAKELKTRFLELGASASLMSGSGPSVFGVFDSREAAVSAQKSLTDAGYRAYFATTV